MRRVSVKGHRGYSVSLNTNSINRALKDLEVRVERASIPALTEIAEKGKVFAEKLYVDAKYDGEHDATLFVSKEGTRTVDLTAAGDSVLFIEYGTGVRGNGKEKKWYFSAKGRDIKLTASGEPAPYVRGGYDKVKYYFETDKGRRHNISELGYDYSSRVYGDLDYDGDKPSAITFYRGETKVRYDVKSEVEHVPREVVKRTDVFITKGNPPQMIMQQTKEYMFSIAPEVITRHLKDNA